MRSRGISFEVRTGVPKGHIDLSEGLRRQARMIAKLNDEAVMTMAIAMQAPDAAFPMPILQEPPHNAHLWPWSGNHRLAAHDLAFPDEVTIDAYTVCIKSPLMIDLFPRVVNAWESPLGFSREEKIQNARWMIDQHSMPVAEACREFGVKPEWVYKENASAAVKEIVKDIPNADKIPKTTLGQLHPIAEQSPQVVRTLVKVLTKYGVKGDEAKHLIADVRSSDGDAQKTAELERWESLLQARLKPKRRTKGVEYSRQIRDSLFRHVTGLAKILEKCDTLKKLQITDPADMSLLERSYNVIREGMRKVAESARDLK